MPHWPLPGGPALSVVRQGVTPVTITASATPHAKGAWVELVASLARGVSILDIAAYDTAVAATNTGVLLDIGVGAGGSEKVLIPDLNVGACRSELYRTRAYRFPIAIPSGSRLAARCQAVVVSDTVLVIADAWGGIPAEGPGRRCAAVDAMGIVSASSKGTTVATGTSGAKGSWTTIIASTLQAYSGLALGFAVAGDTSVTTDSGLIDVAIGAAASEKIIWPDIAFATTVNEDMWAQSVIADLVCPLDLSIPKGSRLAIRASYSNAASQNLDFSLYGLRR